MTPEIRFDGRATMSKSTFRMTYSVGIHINATPEQVEAVLTDAERFPSWNSTVESIEGEIAKDARIVLVSTLAPERPFKLRVTELVPGERMVWSDGMAPMFKGTRTFQLRRCVDGSTDFSMVEVFKGVMLPMIAGSLPNFGPSFEAYARDLKREAERLAAGAYALAS
jgi:hypothetical protein